MAMAGNDKLHVVMFPWLAFGHILPNLELAKLIAQKGHLVTFVSTPRNINRLPKLPLSFASLIKLHKLPLPKVPNLPDDAEATTDVPYNAVPYLKKAYDLLQEPMTRFLESSRPDWIIYDFAPYWIGPVASKLGMKSAFFCIFAAPTAGFFGPASVLMGYDNVRVKPEHFTVPPPWVPFPTSVVCRCFEMARTADIFSEESGVTDTYRAGASIQNCDVVASRGCSEFAHEWFQVLENIYQKPVLPVGHLPTTVYDGGDDIDKWRWIKDWLEKQRKGTVVYVAFGSETKPNQEEVREIALGLEESELPFFWVLKCRRGPTDPEVPKLPDGFENRTRDRGVVRTDWAPQMKILGHGSVGVFLTHAGCSSVVEAVQNEIPLVLLPFTADQGLYARFLEEKKMGYSIPRDERDGSFTSDSVAESLRMVVTEEEGRVYKEKIKEMKDLFVNNERQERYVDSFLAYLKTHKNARCGSWTSE